MACWVGLMGPQDRIDLALDAIQRLVEDLGRRDCVFVFIGDGECLSSLRARVHEMGIERWVRFTGWLEEHDCFSFLASADLGFDPNLQPEVTPVKGMEYMAFSLPFVAFDLPETRAMATDGAMLVAPGDVTAFACAIDGLLDDPEGRELMGEKGRRRVEDELAWDRQKEGYLEVFADALTSRPANGGPEPLKEILRGDADRARQDLEVSGP